MHTISRRAPSGLQLFSALKQRALVPTTQHVRYHTIHKEEIPSKLPYFLGDPTPPTTEEKSSLSVLPLKTVLRSLVINSVSASPMLLPPSLALMSVLAHSTNPILNPDVNPLLKFAVKSTFYAQFCAGENRLEVGQTIKGLKRTGFSGVILCYAKEVVLSESQMKELPLCKSKEKIAECVREEIEPWKEGTMETVRLTMPGDYVALKFTGAGRQALLALSNREAPSRELKDAIEDICKLAISRGVRILVDAEQVALQPGVDDWTLKIMRKFNKDAAHIYSTYQTYLKSAAGTLLNHLKAAQEDNFVLGVKLVRGAYIGSDPRHYFHDTKADTDKTFNQITISLINRIWNDMLPGSGAYPRHSLCVATHNAESVNLARDLIQRSTSPPDVSFAQLQGMADDVSCDLLVAKRRGTPIQAFKYLTWGSTGECMKYLLRRAYENKDAVQRTKEARDAMWKELKLRVSRTFRFY